MRVWIAWEMQRRSETLSAAVGAVYFPLTCRSGGVVRYLRLIFRTIGVLRKAKPDVVFVQNPSVVLAALVCCLRRVMGFVVVMDRHSNLEVHTRSSANPKWLVFHLLSKFSNRFADLTIVTNEGIGAIIRSDGGRTFVLQDPLPSMATDEVFSVARRPAAAFICTFSPDEPIHEVVEAAVRLNSKLDIYVTGRGKPDKKLSALLEQSRGHVHLTGFLPDPRYKALVAAVDFVIVLTTQDDTLVCGAYEAYACGKPLLLSDTKALRDYFSRGAIYASPDVQSIASAMSEVLARCPTLASEAVEHAGRMRNEWGERYAKLDLTLRSLPRPPR